MKSETPYKPVILITGCSSGIGHALAKLFYSQQQYRVVVTARPKSLGTLREMFQDDDRFWVRPLDVTDEDQIETLVREMYRTWKAIDIVINNAGIAYRSVLEHMDEESEMHQLKTNYLGPMSLLRAVVPTMREKGYGHILNVSSVSGMMAMPTMGSYSASKAALESASEALWYELRPFGIKVSIIQPGFVHSHSFHNVYSTRKSRLSRELTGPYVLHYNSVEPLVAKLMNFSASTPEKIAKKVLKAVQQRDPSLWIPVTPCALLFGALRRFLPHQWFSNLMYRLLPGSMNWFHKYPRLVTMEKTYGKVSAP